MPFELERWATSEKSKHRHSGKIEIQTSGETGKTFVRDGFSTETLLLIQSWVHTFLSSSKLYYGWAIIGRAQGLNQGFTKP